VVCQCFEILHDSREMELIACAGEPPQSHALEAVMGLQVRKAHLNLFAFIAGFGELRRSHQCTSMVAGIFVDVARDDALCGIRAAL